MSVIASGATDTPLGPHNLVQTFTVTCAAGTASTSPVTQDTTLGVVDVSDIQIVIPSGHSGLTGLRILLGGSQVLPRNDGGWIIGDDERLDYQVTGYLNTGLWQAEMYNTGIYDHSWQLRYTAEYVYPDPTPPAPLLIPSPIIV